jgi:hypothetical protein
LYHPIINSFYIGKFTNKSLKTVKLMEFQSIVTSKFSFGHFYISFSDRLFAIVSLVDWKPKDMTSLMKTGVAVGNAMVDLDYIAMSHDLITNKSVNRVRLVKFRTCPL